MSWVGVESGYQIWDFWVESELSQFGIFELSLEKWSGELCQSWITWIVAWVRVESARKIWVEHNPDAGL